MKAHKVLTVMMALAVVLSIFITSGCTFLRQEKKNEPAADEYAFSENTNPMSINVALSASSATKEFDDQGGVIELSGNTAARLTIQKDSFPDATNISMTEIGSVSGLDKEWVFAAGVQLAPDGTKMIGAAELEIQIPDQYKNMKLMGFSYEGEGRDFSFYPVTISDGSAIFQINGFSGYGIISIGNSKKVPPQPSTIEKQARQYIAAILMEDGSAGEDQLGRIRNILKAWYDTSVKLKLAAAETNSDAIEDAAREFLSWLKLALWLGVDNDFSAAVEESYASLVKAIKNGVITKTDICIKEKDPSQISGLLYLYRLTIMLGLDGRDGLSAEEIRQQAWKLACFELKISVQTRMTYQDYSEDIFYVDLTGRGSVPLSLKDNFMLDGTGVLPIDKMIIHVDIPLDFTPADLGEAMAYWMVDTVNGDQETDYDESYAVSVLPIRLDISAAAPDVSLDFTLGWAGEAYDGWEDDSWYAIFKACHSSELAGGSFHIAGWEVIGKGSVFARTTLSGTTALEDYNFEDTTTLELIFTPEAG